MADYEVKLIIKDDLPIREKSFIKNVIKELCDELEMMVQEDGITYSKKPPFKKLEDIPAGFTFYNKLRKYRDYFSVYEYYSYLEGDYNGKIYRKSTMIENKKDIDYERVREIIEESIRNEKEPNSEEEKEYIKSLNYKLENSPLKTE